MLASDDGVAFRQAGVRHEESTWRAPAGSRAWLQSYRRDYEGRYEAVDLRSAKPGDYGFPALLEAGAGTWALLTESGLTREAATHLTVAPDRPGALAMALPDGEAAPNTTPWRVAMVGDLPTVVGSDLAMSLGRPSRIRDTSWIRPGRVAWSWWSDPASPGDAARQRAYVRAAAPTAGSTCCSTPAGIRPRSRAAIDGRSAASRMMAPPMKLSWRKWSAGDGWPTIPTWPPKA